MKDNIEQIERLIDELSKINIDPFHKDSKHLGKALAILNLWRDDEIIKQRRFDDEMSKLLSDDEMSYLEENYPALWLSAKESQDGRV